MNVTQITAMDLAKKIVYDIDNTPVDDPMQGSLTLLSAPSHGGKSIISLLTAHQLATEQSTVHQHHERHDFVSLFVGTEEQPPMLLKMAKAVTNEPLRMHKGSKLRLVRAEIDVEYIKELYSNNIIVTDGRTKIVAMERSAHDGVISDWTEPPFLQALVIDARSWERIKYAGNILRELIRGGTHVVITSNRCLSPGAEEKKIESLSEIGIDVIHSYQVIRPANTQYSYSDEEQYYELVFDQ